jgi:hypothetical protein
MISQFISKSAKDWEQMQCNLISQVLSEMIYLYPPSDVKPYRVVDALLLLGQKPLVICFYDKSGEFMTSTFSDPEFSDAFQEAIKAKKVPVANHFPAGNMQLAFYEILDDIPNGNTGSGEVNFVLADKKVVDLYQMLFETILKHTELVDDNLADDIATQLRGFVDNKIKSPPMTASSPSIPPEYKKLIENETEEFLFSMRSVLEEAFAESLESPLLSLSKDLGQQGRTPNVFCLVRTALGSIKRHNSFDYTIREVLLGKAERNIRELTKSEIESFVSLIRDKLLDAGDQQSNVLNRGSIDELIKKWCSSSEQIIRVLERPISNDSRFVADSVFASGISETSFIRKSARHTLGESPTGMDLLRNCMWGILLSFHGTTSRACFVPVHVGGSPWLAIFTTQPGFEQASDIRAWLHFFRFYRSLTPQFASKLRAGTAIVFRRFIARHFGEVLRNKDSDRKQISKEVNHRWMALSTIFPFEVPQLKLDKLPEAKAIPLDGQEPLWLTLEKNRFLREQVEDKLRINPKNVLDDCTAEQKKLREEKKQIAIETDRRVAEEYRIQTHTVMNMLPVNTIRIARKKLENPKNHEMAMDWLKDAQYQMEMLQVAWWIILNSREQFRVHVLEECGVDSVDKLVKWLFERKLSVEPDVERDFQENPRPYRLSGKHLSDAYTVLWNLWHNMIKDYREVMDGRPKCKISLRENGDRLLISFQNEGQMEDRWRQFLKGGHKVQAEFHSGLEIVLNKARELNWEIADVSVEKNRTTISVSIPYTNDNTLEGNG